MIIKKLSDTEEKMSKWEEIKFSLYYQYIDSLKYVFPFRQIGKIKWFIHDLLWPKQKWMMNGIARSWQDKDYVIKTVLFNAIIDFVEEEKCFEVTDWEGSGEGHAKAAVFIKDCYDYIKVRRPAMEAEINRITSEGSEDLKGDLNSWIRTKSYEERYPNLDKLEAELAEKDQFYMIGIVKNVDYLWT